MRRIRLQCKTCFEYIHKYDYDLCLISPGGKMSDKTTERKCKDYLPMGKLGYPRPKESP